MADINEDEFEDVGGVEDEIAVLESVEGVKDETVPEPLDTLYKFHPESILDYAESVAPKIPLKVAISDSVTKDPEHRSQPFLTIFERTKILGFRANQLAQGARPYVDVPEHIVQTLDIAKLELEQRRLPFILKRPMPDGTFEYWRLSDLIML
jgi:DNA-directed RNA polymerase I, II, and III subunit RPABC2